MDETNERLEEETKKWMYKLEQELPKIRSTGNIGEKIVQDSLTNINAYVSDCKYFQEQGDWIRAFESIVYAWGIYETMMRMKAIDVPEDETYVSEQPDTETPDISEEQVPEETKSEYTPEEKKPEDEGQTSSSNL